jgi:hypothetical protein
LSIKKYGKNNGRLFARAGVRRRFASRRGFLAARKSKQLEIRNRFGAKRQITTICVSSHIPCLGSRFRDRDSPRRAVMPARRFRRLRVQARQRASQPCGRACERSVCTADSSQDKRPAEKQGSGVKSRGKAANCISAWSPSVWRKCTRQAARFWIPQPPAFPSWLAVQLSIPSWTRGSEPKPANQWTSGSRRNQVICRLA